MSVLAVASSEFGQSVLRGAPRSNDGSNHAQDRHYHSLRDQASQAQSKHAHFAAEASKAYKRGDKAEASNLSQKSKSFQAEADRLNEEAATWVFRANNTDSAADEIDLHGLFVKEAIIALGARIQVCRQNNQPLLKAIVGKGLHSETHIAKLRPAVMDYCNQSNIPNEIDRHNAGVVLIHIARAGQAPANLPPASSGGFLQYQQGGYGGSSQQYAQNSRPNQYSQNYNQPHGAQQTSGQTILGQIFAILKQCLS